MIFDYTVIQANLPLYLAGMLETLKLLAISLVLGLLAALPLTPAVLVDLPGRRLVVDGHDVDLTRQEFDLVAYLAHSAGRVVTRDELYDGAWRSHDLSDRTRTVDVHVRRVRAKSGLDGLIATVRGVGYRLNVLDGLRVEG